jgi:hypothetical protein
LVEAAGPAFGGAGAFFTAGARAGAVVTGVRLRGFFAAAGFLRVVAMDLFL